ncbi:right-handed parallel beta-helix repeat-containing protein [Nostoc sp. CENA67]|uniref:Right-handed parallel beta-helix repeat-containing protein n=1 Tax=Amazonocrinis nigriterrae CENA67 TaxID=2794033 RepID=A0A8J7HZ13_9NOST|nr:right-handed parallel beta-helix repeat-containing protein [Amazonocrinis nigriterrae]MBH8566255.1 right-handed parallel beta-helix repeat-containing protein [Amazonocrinis nigriterrae CENA67]
MFLSRVLATTLVVGLGIDMGLKAESFDNADLSLPKLTHTDTTANFNTAKSAPAFRIGSDKLALATSGTTYYVSPTGNDDNNGLTEGTALRTLQKAANKVKNPGDTVYIMNGTYTQDVTNPGKSLLTIYLKQGSADAPITFKAYPGHKPLLKSTGSYAITVSGSSYINIEGLKLVGSNDKVTLEYAQQQKNNLKDPLTNGAAIMVAPSYSDGIITNRSHHILIRNNNVSKFGGCGICTNQADYITIEKNVVSETAWYSPIGTSPISTLHNWNADNNTTDYKIIIRENVVYNNINYIPRYDSNKATEGHGIIIDDALNTQTNSTNVPYTGKTLITNNVVYKNGGGGIHVFKSPNVDVINNTTYQNVQSPDLLGVGEINAIRSENVKVFNNIMVPTKDGLVNNVAYAVNTIYENNLVYNSSKFKTLGGLSNIIGKDPKFVDAANGNFYPHSNSPAIDVGLDAFNGAKAPKIDQLNATRPIDGDGNGIAIIDIGAFERK